MAQDDLFDLAGLERLVRRLQALKDAEAIRNLKARYVALCDAQYDADGIAMLFTEDARWESPGLGRFEGREAIRGFFRGASGIFSFAIDYSLNGQIEVEGDTAQARWYLFMPCTAAAGNQARTLHAAKRHLETMREATPRAKPPPTGDPGTSDSFGHTGAVSCGRSALWRGIERSNPLPPSGSLSSACCISTITGSLSPRQKA